MTTQSHILCIEIGELYPQALSLPRDIIGSAGKVLLPGAYLAAV